MAYDDCRDGTTERGMDGVSVQQKKSNQIVCGVIWWDSQRVKTGNKINRGWNQSKNVKLSIRKATVLFFFGKVQNSPWRILSQQKGTNFYHKKIKKKTTYQLTKLIKEYEQSRAPTWRIKLLLNGAPIPFSPSCGSSVHRCSLELSVNSDIQADLCHTGPVNHPDPCCTALYYERLHASD